MWEVGRRERSRVKAFTRGCKYTESNLYHGKIFENV